MDYKFIKEISKKKIYDNYVIGNIYGWLPLVSF
jgi:hypothetical protein